MQNVSNSPPRAPPIKYSAPLGTRWAKEKAAAGGSAAFDLPTDPKTIGPWILGECVGKGASGRVKIARHRRTGQLAAVKILPIAPLMNSRASLATQQAKSEKQRLGVDREITMMKLMNHPNIMRIYDVYEADKELFLVLEYVEGGELFDFLVNRGRLPTHEALIYFRQIVYGLNYAHTFSIIHRDLKPENILISSLSPPSIKLADWGMAAFAPPALQLETSCGSPHYASPEIVNGEKYQGNATDIWSCGVILFALLTGRLPFDDKNVRTLLSKVKSGKYEMPTWIDPLARDLLSKMLVVDVKQRITIPQILAHPWLVSQPSILFSASDGKTHALLPPPLPPSPNVLGRPIASPGLIDPELFASLRVIWGRHADSDGESIRGDLCSPAGQGVHAKAFYFLLDKYRDESSQNRLLEAEIEKPEDSSTTVVDLEEPTTSLGWEVGPSGTVAGVLRRHEVSKNHPLFSTSPVTSPHGSRTSPPPGYLANVSLRSSSSATSRKRTFTDVNLPADKDRLDFLSSSRPPSSNKTQVELWKAQMLAAQREGSAASSNRPKSSLGDVGHVGRAGGSRPPQRRGYTYSTMPEKRDGEESASLGFSQHLQQLQARAASSSHKPKLSIGQDSNWNDGDRKVFLSEKGVLTDISGELGAVSAATKPPDYLGSPVTASAAASGNGIASSTTDVDMAKVTDLDLPLLAAPRTNDPILQRTMEDLTQKVNELVQAASQVPLEAFPEKESAKGPAVAHVHHKPSKARIRADKENHIRDEEWSHVSADGNGRAGGLGLGVGSVLGNRDVMKVRSSTTSPAKAKKEKEKKGRPPPLELPSLNPKRATFAMLGSPIALSSPIHPPSSATRILASPVVGEFKGWFSNLFNWKNSSPNGGVIYSPDDIQSTQSNVINLLEGMGIIVASQSPVEVHHPIEVGDVLHCRLDQPSIDAATGLPLKNVRFNVEFRAGPTPSDLQLTMSPISEHNPYFVAAPPQAATLSGCYPVTPITANGGGSNMGLISSSRPRNSILLGGRSYSHGTPLPSPALLTGSARGDSTLPPGCLCAVALVHEKGSMSTFRLVWRKLREEYGDANNTYPCFSPAIPNTPHPESQRMAVM